MNRVLDGLLEVPYGATFQNRGALGGISLQRHIPRRGLRTPSCAPACFAHFCFWKQAPWYKCTSVSGHAHQLFVIPVSGHV